MSDHSPSRAGTDVRKTVTDRWLSVLQQDEELEDYTFFELGGTSIAASQLILQLSRDFGQRIPLTALTENPTLRQFRDHLTLLVPA
ncbi:phosphopantetheine-binding protein [Streptomyces sp. NBC_01335]|uniref:phosphopantetheine-binding protein n=1 Tax=Streptomyces sp. NBC_01335 TaxID=2903828 RepID=UPI002E0E099E|nr:phosphopantetheine-binding protein [Streptomyces sp. NBC_01335]